MWRIPQHTLCHLVKQKPDTWFVLFLYSPCNILISLLFLADSFIVQPLPQKLILRKKRAREGKSTEEVEQFAVPRSVTVRRRTDVAINVLTEEEVRKTFITYSWFICTVQILVLTL